MDKMNNLQEENTRLRQWINDLQSGMYINCVYCGHRYGPKEDTPVATAEVLKEHIEQCPEHPLSKAKKRIDKLEKFAKYTMLWLEHTGGIETHGTHGRQCCCNQADQNDNAALDTMAEIALSDDSFNKDVMLDVHRQTKIEDTTFWDELFKNEKTGM